ncbi:hypothetical protein BHM03_00014121, partial [Ensete ventricosum]
MSQERPFGDSGAEHHPEPDHPRPTEEAAVAVPTPNRFWRIMTDSGLSISRNDADHSPVPAPARAFDDSPIDSPSGTPANGVTSGPKPGSPARGRAATASGHRSPHSFPDPDPDASPITKSLLQSEGSPQIKRGGWESSKGGSPFTPEIQAKMLPTTFRFPALEPYDGSDDQTEHFATFRAQMTLYDTSDALMCWAFPTTLRGSARA